jgi:hypothetical protein
MQALHPARRSPAAAGRISAMFMALRAAKAGPGALENYEDDEADAQEDGAIDSGGIAPGESDLHALVSDDPSGGPPLK